jgi:hypothetical protein
MVAADLQLSSAGAKQDAAMFPGTRTSGQLCLIGNYQGTLVPGCERPPYPECVWANKNSLERRLG